MKRALSLVALTTVLGFPALLFADSCSTQGYSVFIVNGIFNTQEKADEGSDKLKDLLGDSLNKEALTVRSAYNPTHIAGLGDVVQAVTQAFNQPVSNFDRDTILHRIHSQLKTQKILLVGHSQGTFYTNELYKYLTTHGVPKESIGVYNIATPASYVEGGGGYVTSTNDKIINLVRNTEVDGNLSIHLNSYYVLGNTVNSALRANITVPKEPGYDQSDFGGHKLSVYLDGAAPRIMSDIDASLRRLKASGGSSSESCFEPPVEDISYKAKSLFYAMVDPLAEGTKTVAVATRNGAEGFTDYVAAGINDTKSFAQSVFKNLASANNSSTNQAAAAVLATPVITTKPVPQNAPKPPPAPVTKVTVQTPSQADSVKLPVQSPDMEKAPEENNREPVAPAVVSTAGFGGGQPSSPQQQDPTMVALSITAPANNALVATSSVVLVGTADVGALVTASFNSLSATTTADGAGEWTVQLTLLEGTTTVTVSAVDAAGKSSAVLSRDIVVDTMAPTAPTLGILECASTIVTGLCVVPITAATLDWSDSGADHYRIFRDGGYVASFIATSSTQAISTNATSSFEVVAYDLAGNAATSSAVNIYALSQSVIINEIGWGGTDTGSVSGQQWIELKNMSAFMIDLSHVVISRSGGAEIALAGASIPAHGGLVVEQTDIAFTGTNKLVTPFSDLSTVAAEQLAITWRGTLLDASPAVSTCSSWCSGGLNVSIGTNVSGVAGFTSSLSMERVTNAADGTLASSWQSTDSYNAAFWGTPNVENSSGLPESGVICSAGGLLVPSATTRPYDTGNVSCTYLMKFISSGTTGAPRYAGLYMGTVGSSTVINAHFFSKSMQRESTDVVPPGTPAGTEFFFVIYEAPTWMDAVTPFGMYFTKGSDPANGGAPPPHGNYVTIPFVYQP